MVTILIVEDDAVMCSEIEKTIYSIRNDRDIKILKSKKGKQALEISNIMKIDVFIIDIGLPDWDGLELAIELRKTYPYQPIIIESSQGEANYQVTVYDKISNLAFLKKPYTKEKLIAKVKHALKITDVMGSTRLNIKQHGFSRQININEIVYIEKIKNTKKIQIILYNKDKKILSKETFQISLSSVFDMLEDKKVLFRCHKAYIVNPRMIERLNYANDTISLTYSNDEIPIGKTYKSAVSLLL